MDYPVREALLVSQVFPQPTFHVPSHEPLHNRSRDNPEINQLASGIEGAGGGGEVPPYPSGRGQDRYDRVTHEGPSTLPDLR